MFTACAHTVLDIDCVLVSNAYALDVHDVMRALQQSTVSTEPRLDPNYCNA